MPSSGSSNEIEKILGNWCSKRRKDKKLNKLSNEKIKLIEKINGWYWIKFKPTIIKTFIERYNELVLWIEKNKRLPYEKSKNDEERYLGSWCSHRRTDKKKGILTEDKIKKIEEIKDWYWIKK